MSCLDCTPTISILEPQQQLYVRLFLRKHYWIRTSKLSYKDIADNLQPVIDGLVASMFLINGETQKFHIMLLDLLYI